MKKQLNLSLIFAIILLGSLLGIFLTLLFYGYIYSAGEADLEKMFTVLQLLQFAFIFCAGIMSYQLALAQKLRKEILKQNQNAALPYCCPGHDFSCPYISSPYQKSKDCSECENSSDLIKVWVLNNSVWDDKNCPNSTKRYADTECYMAKIIALKEAKETENIGVGSCVFVNGMGAYCELVSKVKL